MEGNVSSSAGGKERLFSLEGRSEMKCLPGGSAFCVLHCHVTHPEWGLGRQKSDFSSLRPWNSEILLQRKGTKLDTYGLFDVGI
jgi:hypothetical protein